MGAGEVAAAVAALRAGAPVILPTDGVYGLCSALDADAVAALYALKGRGAEQPAAIIAADLDALARCLPEIDTPTTAILGTLLPGAYTLVVDNPARRFPWLCGATPEAIGVRVARLPGETQRVLDAVSAVAATSANLPGEPSPASLDAVPAALRTGAAAALDGGVLPGAASTVIDLTRPGPVVIRAGAGAVDQALAAIARVRGASA